MAILNSKQLVITRGYFFVSHIFRVFQDMKRCTYSEILHTLIKSFKNDYGVYFEAFRFVVCGVLRRRILQS